ncbi:hypothetical protein HZC00_05375 [Candidatus Kaiserbacteria bacterium]|nr:hypothetical protein [Candidatus Kaiserbacteria bacterium]
MSRKKIDLLVIVILLSLGAILSLALSLKALNAGLVYLVPASVYLMLRERKNYQKIFLGTLVFGLLFGFFFDFIETYSGAWTVVNLVIPYKVLGVLPVDDMIGFVLMTLFTFLFYEHFLDDERTKRLSSGLSQALFIGAVLVIFTIVMFIADPLSMSISHAYLKGGLAALIFPIIFSWRNPKIIGKFAILSLFFFFVWLVAEVIAVKNGNWIYPGQYVGWVNVFGVTFPLEELFFWALCYSATITAFYERFIDDGK